MNKSVTIVDYGVGNILNVKRAFEHVGATVFVADTAKDIVIAQRLVLPGVGAFRDGMAELNKNDLVLPIRDFVASGKSLLGICLGMQMLFDSSEEFGLCEGLGLIAGKVVAIPSLGHDGQVHKVPHIGWCQLVRSGEKGWRNTIFNSVSQDDSVYMVHSFMGCPDNNDHRLADCYYSGQKICAAVKKRNITGCQFHPEKSGEVGLRMLSDFISCSVV